MANIYSVCLTSIIIDFMKIIKTKIPDLLIFEPKVFGDERGFFMETFRESFLKEAGINYSCVQDNHSSSTKGVLRGLHYQTRQSQGKLVRVIAGEVYDVAVDMRKNSSTFGQHVGEYLSAENRKIFWVPPGFAHGFLVTSDYAEFVYKCTDYYAPEYEKTLLWNDKALNINWPIDGEPELSLKDKEGDKLIDAEAYSRGN